MLEVLRLTLVMATPLILAAMGGFTSERGGVINIGLEGLVLMAACVTALASPFGPAGGLLAGIGAATLLSLLHWVATQFYRIDHVISGMAINAIAAGGTNFLFGRFGNGITGSLPTLSVNLFMILALLVPPALWYYVRVARGGLRLLAVGSDPDKARLIGVDPLRVRLAGLIATGVLCGLGGAMLVSDVGVFTDGMTDGRGFIALAALVLGGWRPLPAMLACIGFGFFNALRVQFQGTTVFGASLPSEAWASLPYLVTIIALAGFLGRSRTPAGLGKP